jgi:hypothetical protein
MGRPRVNNGPGPQPLAEVNAAGLPAMRSSAVPFRNRHTRRAFDLFRRFSRGARRGTCFRAESEREGHYEHHRWRSADVMIVP